MLMYFPYAWTERRYMVRSAISYCWLISGPVKCIQVSKKAGNCWLTFIIQSMCVTVCLLFRDIRSWAKRVYWLHKHTFHPSPPCPLYVPLMMYPEFKKATQKPANLTMAPDYNNIQWIVMNCCVCNASLR